MKKLLSFLMMFTLFFGVGWAEKVTFEVGTDSSQGLSMTKSGMTIEVTDGTFSRTDNYRCYANKLLKITSVVGDITKVEITCTGSGTNNNGPGKFSLSTGFSGTYSYDGNMGTWTGEASSVSLSASAQVRFTKVEITYTPSTLETCATPAFSPEPGTYYASQSVTISSTDGATIRYTTDGTEPTASTGTVYNGPITVDETTTIKAIATKQSYNNSSVETALYLISEPVANGKATFNAVNDRGTGSITKSPITFACSNGVLNNGTQYGLYKNSITTFSAEDGYTITKIEFTCTANEANQYGPGCFAAQSGYSYEDNIGTWEGEAQSVEFVAETYGVRATLINVYFVESSAITVGVPSISFADFTAGSTTVTATITAGTNATSTEYKIGEDGTYTATDGTVSIDLTSIASPITIYAKSLNGESESNEVYETFNLPALSVGVSPESYAGEDAQSVTISASNNVGTATITYKINDGETQEYSSPISLSDVGTYNITAYATDQRAGGEQVTATATITITEHQSGSVTATFKANEDKDTENTSQGEGSITKQNITFECSDGILGNGSEYRLYKNSTTKFSVPTGSKITKIVFNCTASGTTKYGPGCFATQSGYSYEGNIGTWEGNAQSVSFTASSNQVRCTEITVTYIAGETPDVVEYYLAGDLNGWGNPVDVNYKFTQQQDGSYVLEKLIPDMDNADNIRFKIAKVVNGGTPVLYGGSGNGDYGINRIWNNTNDIVLGNDNDHQQAFSMPDCFNAIFTLNADNMTFSVEKPQLYLIGTFNNYVTPTNDNVNGAKEMTPDTENGGWTLTDEFTDGAEFRLYDAWHVHHGGNGYWINESDYGHELNISNNDWSIFHIVGNGNYTFTVNGDITKLVADRIPEKYTATIASGIEHGAVSFSATGQQNTLSDITEGHNVIVYVTPASENWELATLTYTVEGSSEAFGIAQTEGVYSFAMPAGNVTINATFNWIGGEITETTYELVRSNDDLEVGAKYIIVNEDANRAFVKAYNSQAIQINNHTTTISNNSGIPEFVLGTGTEEGTYTFKYGDLYLYNSSSTSLDIAGNSSTNNDWTISIGDADEYFATVKSANNRIVYYFSSGSDFRAYSATTYTSNIKLYKEVSPAETATLAQIEANPVKDKKYAISDEYLIVAQIIDGIVYAKDNNGAAEQTAADGQIDYLAEKLNTTNTDHSNWIAITGLTGNLSEGSRLTNVVGTLSDAVNFTLAAQSATIDNDHLAEASEATNQYVPCNFGASTLTVGDKTYFFAHPQIMEYAYIFAAVWKGNDTFEVPENNAAGLTGSFTADLNGYGTGLVNDGTVYEFHAVVKKAAAAQGDAPRRIAGNGGDYEVMLTEPPLKTSDISTAVTDVRNAGEVAGVKYVNVAGQVSSTPWQGVNIVVTRMSDGTTRTAKVVK